MEEEADMEARERAAFKRITAAARKLAVGTDAAALVDDVSSANHRDTDVRVVRRNEALANFMEALVGGTAEASKPGKGENKGKATPAESAKAE